MILKKRGYKGHPGSGSGSIPFDGSDKNDLCEVKDANVSFTLNARYLKRFWLTAIRDGKRPVLVIYFKSIDLTLTITFEKGKQ